MPELVSAQRFAVVDVETSGLSEKRHHVLQVGVVVVDGTGVVLVRMLRPQISADLEEGSFSDPILPPTPQQEGFLRRHQAWHPAEGKPPPRLRYLESLFELDEQITVYGVVRFEREGDSFSVRVVIEAPPGQPLLVSDDKQITRSPSPASTTTHLSMSSLR